jgi:hypothetical protein
MPLPFSRERDYTDDTPVDPNDMNAIQDSISAEHNRSIHFAIPPYDPTAFTPHIEIDLSPWLIPGDTIKEFVFRWWNGDTPVASEIHFSVVYANVLDGDDPDNGTSIVGPDPESVVSVDTNTGGANLYRTQTVASNHVVVANRTYIARIDIIHEANEDNAAPGPLTLVLGD